MSPVFADASYYVAILSPRDQHHHDAIRLSSELRRPVVVTEFVLIEVANALSSIASRQRAVSLWKHLEADPTVQVVPASHNLVQRGLSLFADRQDKQWSLTDCISLVVIEERAITEALTSDHHFEQAGISALLLS